jgi:hypothetical protein
MHREEQRECAELLLRLKKERDVNEAMQQKEVLVGSQYLVLLLF